MDYSGGMSPIIAIIVLRKDQIGRRVMLITIAVSAESSSGNEAAVQQKVQSQAIQTDRYESVKAVDRLRSVWMHTPFTGSGPRSLSVISNNERHLCAVKLIIFGHEASGGMLGVGASNCRLQSAQQVPCINKSIFLRISFG